VQHPLVRGNQSSQRLQVDNRSQSELLVDAERAKKWCSVHWGIGGDGVIFALPPTEGADFSMRIFNSDGSEPEMCGNGIRCLAKFVADTDNVSSATYKVHTVAGARSCSSACHQT
jgi:diaminopimelate epimerase